jgi:urease accessory protein
VQDPPTHLIRRAISEASARPASEQVVLRAPRRMFLKRRWRGVADDGVTFGFDLESRLRSGSVIRRTPEADYVIVQDPEPVYVVRPSTVDEAARLGWKIGNLHLPVEISGGAVRALHDPAVRQLLERDGREFTEETVLFQPFRIAPHAP